MTAAILETSTQWAVSRCWHPDPKADLIPAHNGSNVSVLVGEPAYQLSNGSIIQLEANNV